MTVKNLFEIYQARVEALKSEIKELSCNVNAHPDDVELCKKLTLKLDLYQNFLKDLEKVKED